MKDKLLRLREVEEIVGMKKSTIYRMIASEQFPAPIKIGGLSRWAESVIQEWIKSVKLAA